MRQFLRPALVLAAAATAAAPADAAVTQVKPGVDGSYVQLEPRAPGVYGVELRGGRPGARDWEIGVGNWTSHSGTFNQGEYDWTANGGTQSFELTWLGSGLTMKVGGITVTDSGAGKGAPLVGDTLKIYLKGSSSLTLTELDGSPLGTSFSSPAAGEYFFWSNDNWGGDGFTARGTLSILNDGGSANGIEFKVGDFTPNPGVPEPTTWAMLIAGFGLVGLSMRRRRTDALPSVTA
jgi:hypothetical protein